MRGFMNRPLKKQEGFTLLELIIVIVAVIILAIIAVSLSN